MLERPTFQNTWLPLGLTVLAVLVLNFGLYTRLSPPATPPPPAFTLPYFEDFTELTTLPYEEFGGDWELRDQTLVQLSTSGYDLMAFVPIDIADDQPYTFQTQMQYLGGDMGGGLMFNAQQVTSRQQSHMVRFNVDGGQLWLIYGYFGDDSNFVGQGSAALGLTPDDNTPHTLGVQVTGERYALLFDGAVVAADVPLVYQGGAVGFIAATSQVAFDNVSVEAGGAAVAAQPPQATPAPNDTPVEAAVATATPGELLFAESFDATGSGESLWLPISGTWVVENGTFVQTQPDAFDLSAIYQVPVGYPLTLSTTLQHRSGAGGGLLFNLPDADSRNGGHLVRYFDAGDIIAWGYFDENGVFVGQGNVTVALPGDTPHTLTVTSDGQTYAATLDGAPLFENAPLVNPVTTGYVGLTASQTVVAFDDVAVFTAGAADVPVGDPVANIDADAATGQWEIDGGTIRQIATDGQDYVAGVGLAGEQFTVSVEVALPPDNPEAGAGIVFHMDGRDDPRTGHMVRFANGGSELFWGSYDADGAFTGEGGIPLTLDSATAHTLLLVVREGNYDIQVDGVTLVEAIPIQRTNGWIGLVSFSGPVTFSNINVQLGE